MKRLEIRPQIIGELTWSRQSGTHAVIVFDCHGYAWAEMSVNTLEPVHKADGSWLRIPGYDGLACEYDATTGTLKNFREKNITA